MFGSWLLGFIGTLVGLGGGLLSIAGFFIGVGNKEWGVLVVGIIVIALASFLKYLSKQTVRVRH